MTSHENRQYMYASFMHGVIFILLLACSRRSVSWGVARKMAHEKIGEKCGAGRLAPRTKPLSPLFRSAVFSHYAPTNGTTRRGYFTSLSNLTAALRHFFTVICFHIQSPQKILYVGHENWHPSSRASFISFLSKAYRKLLLISPPAYKPPPFIGPSTCKQNITSDYKLPLI